MKKREFKFTKNWKTSVSKKGYKTHLNGDHWDKFGSIITKIKDGKKCSIEGCANLRLVISAPTMLGLLQVIESNLENPSYDHNIIIGKIKMVLDEIE